MEYILKRIDDDLWYRVKVMVAIRKTTIRDILIELLTNEVERFESEVDSDKPY